MHRLVPLTSAELLQLTRCAVVFLPASPARTSRFAFWSEDGGAPEGAADELTVALPGEEGGVERVQVPARVLTVREALPALARARADDVAHPAAAFWGAATLFALQLAARGLLLPGLTAQDEDAWRAGPLTAEDLELVRDLSAAMPPQAHATPLPSDDELLLPEPELLVRQFLDAVADTLPRSPAAHLAAGQPAYAVDEPQRLPEQRDWAADVAAGHDAGVRLSLRIEVPGLQEIEAPGPQEGAARFRAVLQMHSAANPTAVADAADVWAESGAAAGAFGPRSRLDAL
ncbi:ATP-dependent helicase, partial [Streptomyces mesophilus]